MATMVTFSLTAVYAQSAMLRLREYYMNQGKNLPKQDSRKTLRHISTIVLYFISWYAQDQKIIFITCILIFCNIQSSLQMLACIMFQGLFFSPCFTHEHWIWRAWVCSQQNYIMHWRSYLRLEYHYSFNFVGLSLWLLFYLRLRSELALKRPTMVVGASWTSLTFDLMMG